MCGTDRLNDCKAQPGSPRVPRACLVGAVKAFEDIGEGVIGYSSTVVRNLQDCRARLSANAYVDFAAFVRVLDGIGNEVCDDLLQMRAISLDIDFIRHSAS